MSNAQKDACVYTHTHTIKFVNLLRTLPGRCLQWLRSDLYQWRRAAETLLKAGSTSETEQHLALSIFKKRLNGYLSFPKAALQRCILPGITNIVEDLHKKVSRTPMLELLLIPKGLRSHILEIQWGGENTQTTLTPFIYIFTASDPCQAVAA